MPAPVQYQRYQPTKQPVSYPWRQPVRYGQPANPDPYGTQQKPMQPMANPVVSFMNWWKNQTGTPKPNMYDTARTNPQSLGMPGVPGGQDRTTREFMYQPKPMATRNDQPQFMYLNRPSGGTIKNTQPKPLNPSAIEDTELRYFYNPNQYVPTKPVEDTELRYFYNPNQYTNSGYRRPRSYGGGYGGYGYGGYGGGGGGGYEQTPEWYMNGALWRI